MEALYGKQQISIRIKVGIHKTAESVVHRLRVSLDNRSLSATRSPQVKPEIN